MTATAHSQPGLSCRGGVTTEVLRALPEETAVAIVVNGTTQAVMMATPADLEDFGTGFALTEGIIAAISEIERIETLDHPAGVELRLWIDGARAEALAARRRNMLGPVGCGLCGIDSLEAALRPLPRIETDLRLTATEVDEAAEALRARQPLHDRTRAVHGAGLWQPGHGLVLAAEDVGRHNALDKLVGAMARNGVVPEDCAVVLTSRVSVDMVQKVAMAGAGMIIAASAPTAHAVRLAEAAGITLACLARGAGCDLFSRPDRVVQEGSDAG